MSQGTMPHGSQGEGKEEGEGGLVNPPVDCLTAVTPSLMYVCCVHVCRGVCVCVCVCVCVRR